MRFLLYIKHVIQTGSMYRKQVCHFSRQSDWRFAVLVIKRINLFYEFFFLYFFFSLLKTETSFSIKLSAKFCLKQYVVLLLLESYSIKSSRNSNWHCLLAVKWFEWEWVFCLYNFFLLNAESIGEFILSTLNICNMWMPE